MTYNKRSLGALFPGHKQARDVKRLFGLKTEFVNRKVSDCRLCISNSAGGEHYDSCRSD